MIVFVGWIAGTVMALVFLAVLPPLPDIACVLLGLVCGLIGILAGRAFTERQNAKGRR